MNLNVLPAQPTGIQSTAGAVPVRNEKGELSMKKVKVQRYISGKKPDYAQNLSSDEDSDAEDFIEQQRPGRQRFPAVISGRDQHGDSDNEVDDPRLRRLRAMGTPPRRAEHQPEVIDEEPESDAEAAPPRRPPADDSDSELDEDEIHRRRQALKARLAAKEAEKAAQGRYEEEEEESDKEESASSDTEYTDSEEETGPRVKPVFVRASERMTVQERERKARQQKRDEADARKEKEERRREALKLVEDTIRADQRGAQDQKEGTINDVCTDDENDELEYEAWKLRELRRVKRDKDERDAVEKELLLVERMRNLTEEERRAELRLHPKVVTNRAHKGKYKFLQKYYHRGAFYLDKEEEVFKQDFSGATLDDHFDKTVLPKVMQVKKFGRSGRTKYTHLVDQDTTEFDSAWSAESAAARLNFRGGMKQVFEKPTAKRKHHAN